MNFQVYRYAQDDLGPGRKTCRVLETNSQVVWRWQAGLLYPSKFHGAPNDANPMFPKLPELSPMTKFVWRKKASSGDDVNGPAKGNKLIFLEIPPACFSVIRRHLPMEVSWPPGETKSCTCQIKLQQFVILGCGGRGGDHATLTIA